MGASSLLSPVLQTSCFTLAGCLHSFYCCCCWPVTLHPEAQHRSRAARARLVSRQLLSSTQRLDSSSALARARKFLPALAQANEELSRRQSADVDIESLTPGSTQHVELDLTCGLLDLKDAAAQDAAVAAAGFAVCPRPGKRRRSKS